MLFQKAFVSANRRNGQGTKVDIKNEESEYQRGSIYIILHHLTIEVFLVCGGKHGSVLMPWAKKRRYSPVALLAMFFSWRRPWMAPIWVVSSPFRFVSLPLPIIFTPISLVASSGLRL